MSCFVRGRLAGYRLFLFELGQVAIRGAALPVAQLNVVFVKVRTVLFCGLCKRLLKKTLITPPTSID